MAKTHRTCSVASCDSAVEAKNFCRRHYRKFLRYGDPLGFTPTQSKAYLWLTEHIGYAADDCLIWPYGRDNHGYARIQYGGKHRTAHSIMCEKVCGPPPTHKHEVRHLCGNGSLGCVNPLHLKWGTRRENAADRRSHGTMVCGTRIYNSKLTETDVREIRHLAKTMRGADIARIFGVHKENVYRILRGKNWSWLKD